MAKRKPLPQIKSVRRALAIEKLSARVCFAMGDMDLTFGEQGYIRQSYQSPTRSWDEIFAMFPKDGGHVQFASVRVGSGFGVVASSVDREGMIRSDFGANGVSFLHDPYFSSTYAAQPAVQMNDGSFILPFSSTTSGDTTLMKVGADGLADSSFGVNGFLAIRNPIPRIVAHPNSGFLVLYSNSGGNDTTEIWKYSANGAVESGFGNAGRHLIPRINPHDLRFVTNNDYIVFGKRFDFAANQTYFLEAKFLANGNVDTTFGNNGIRLSSNGNNNSSHNSYFNKAIGCYLSPDYSFQAKTFSVMSHCEQGEPSLDYGNEGVFTIDLPSFQNQTLNHVKLLEDGSLLVVFRSKLFSSTEDIILIKIDPMGRLATDFGSQGIAIHQFPISSQIRGVDVNAVGELTLYGSDFLSYDSITIRYSAFGKLDLDYGTQGFLLREQNPRSVGIAELDLFHESGNRFRVASGWVAESNSLGRFGLYNPNGVRESELQFGLSGERPTEVVPASDGGWFEVSSNISLVDGHYVSIVKKTKAGSIDTTFSASGRLRVPTLQMKRFSVSQGLDGSYLFVTGEATSTDTTGNLGNTVVFRWNDRGIDTLFGILRLDEKRAVAGFWRANGAVAVQFDARESTIDAKLIGFRSDGSLDDSFGVGGTNSVPVRTYNPVRSIQDDKGRMLLLGRKPDGSLSLVRLNSNGDVDLSFGHPGAISLPITVDPFDPVQLLARNGFVYVVGTHRMTSTREATIRLVVLNNGTASSELGGQGFRDYRISDSSVTATDMIFANDGDLILAMASREGVDRIGKVVRLEGTSQQVLRSWTRAFDTNNDGLIDSLDVLTIVNSINSGTIENGTFPDVDSDDLIGPLDALVIVNKLNSSSNSGNGSGEGLRGEGEAPYQFSSDFMDQYMMNLHLEDVENERGKTLGNGGRLLMRAIPRASLANHRL
jgi:uncharacterized delta-60 repeat protein